MRVRSWFIGISFLALLLFFQNFTLSLQSHIDPNYGQLIELGSNWIFYDEIRNKRHEVKIQGGGEVPKIFYYRRYQKNFLWFEANGEAEYKDRSEIRIVGSDAPFDEVYYTSFKVYYPSWASKIDSNDWALLWQCAQAGDYETPRSPPMSIQFADNKLTLRTFNNYNSKNRIRRYNAHLASFPRNRWVKVFMRYRLGQHGHYKVWINNRVVASERIPIGYKDGVNPFTNQRSCSVRFGIYKKGSQDRVALLFDEVKVGTSYEAVRP